MTYALRAEPLAVWDGRQGRGEARVVIRLITLRVDVSTGDEGRGEQGEPRLDIPYRTRVGRRGLCGIPCTHLACQVRRDASADQSTSHSARRGKMSYSGPR